jgi:hypothetical protein
MISYLKLEQIVKLWYKRGFYSVFVLITQILLIYLVELGNNNMIILLSLMCSLLFDMPWRIANYNVGPLLFMEAQEFHQFIMLRTNWHPTHSPYIYFDLLTKKFSLVVFFIDLRMKNFNMSEFAVILLY